LHSASHTNYDIKVVAATCVDWVAPVAVSKLATSGRRLAATAYNVEGLINMTVRLNSNCSGDYTSSVLINVNITQGSKPLDGVLVNGSVNTGANPPASCSGAAAAAAAAATLLRGRCSTARRLPSLHCH
jgi:hypothetical protein